MVINTNVLVGEREKLESNGTLLNKFIAGNDKDNGKGEFDGGY